MSENWYDRGRLAEHRDANGDLAPPWAVFPNYERYTIGWRMGGGEDWLHKWHTFLEDLDGEYDTRFAYLARHPPAPVNWTDHVYGVLYPSWDRKAESEDEEQQLRAAADRRGELFDLGLIVSDAAYPIWLKQQQGVRWPWEFGNDPGTPEEVARHWTRDLWFWSRQVAALRGTAGWQPPTVPPEWQPCASALETGSVAAPDTHRGLLLLTQMLCTGRVAPPWALSLTPGDFADSFEMSMGYVDAFRLWVMSAFDDREHLDRTLGPAIPPDWGDWIQEHTHFYFE